MAPAEPLVEDGAEAGERALAARSCPLCGARGGEAHWPAPPTWVVRCRGCGLRYVGPRLPDHVETEGYYRDLYLPLVAGQDAAFDSTVRDIERYVPVGRLLDVGCATGEHARAALRRGWQVVGVERAPWAAAYARQTAGMVVHEGTLETLDASEVGFDAALLSEVIEHVDDPVATLVAAAGRLRPGGVVWLSTPNAESLAARVLGAAWDRIVPSGHLQYFDPATLGRLFGVAGLEVEAMNSVERDLGALVRRAEGAGRGVGRLGLGARAARTDVGRGVARALARLGVAPASAAWPWLDGETVVVVGRRADGG